MQPVGLGNNKITPQKNPGTDVRLLTLNIFREPARRGNVIEIADQLEAQNSSKAHEQQGDTTEEAIQKCGEEEALHYKRALRWSSRRDLPINCRLPLDSILEHRYSTCSTLQFRKVSGRELACTQSTATSREQTTSGAKVKYREREGYNTQV